MSKKPKIRFDGFSEDWEEKELGEESLDIVAGGDIDKNKFLDFGEFPVLANALTNNGVIGYYSDSFRIKAPAVTVTGRGDVGHAKARTVNFTPVVRLLSITTYHDVNFLEQAINNHEVTIESTGVPQLTIPQISKYKIFFPINMQEEIKLGQFFKNIDNLITLNQSKYDKLVNVKKAMLEKMFPKDGEKTPQIRFNGFCEDWKPQKLEDVVVFLDEQRKPLEAGQRISGRYPYYGASGIIDYVETYLFDEELILLSEDGANIIDRNYRVCFIATGKYWVNNHAHVLKSNHNHDNRFICEILESINYEKYNTGTAQPKLNQEVCRNIEFKTPSHPEQTKIGNFFKKLDTLIELEKQELEKLKNIKKSCLEKMFV